MGKWWAWSLLMALLLSGCRPAQVTQPRSPVVTKIIADGEYNGEQIYREYISNDKIRQVLLYIRSLRPHLSAGEEPDALEAPQIRLWMYYRDGAVKQYRLKDGRFFREEDGQWQKVNVEKGEKFCQMLRDLPSDPLP